MKKFAHIAMLTIFVGLPAFVLVLILFLNVFNWNHARPLLAKVSRATSPYEVRVDGEWRMHLGRNFEMTLGDFAVISQDYPSDAPPLFKASHLFVRSPVRSFLGSKMVIDRIELAQARIHLLRDDSGKMLFLPLKSKRQKEDKGTTTRIPELNSIDIRDVAVAFEDQSLSENVSLRIDRIRSLAGEGIEPIHIAGQGRLGGQPFSISATWDDTSGHNKGPFDVAVLMELGKNRLVADSKVVMAAEKGGLDHATIALQADMTDPAQVMRILAIPSQRPIPFTLAVNVTARSEDAVITKLRWKSARSSLSGSATLGLKERRPYVDAKVDADVLDTRDIDGFMPPARGKEDGKPKGAPVLSRELINLDAFHSMDMNIAFNLKKLRADNALAVVQAARGNAEMRQGTLKVSVDDMAIGGGHLKLDATLDAKSGKTLEAKTQGQFREISLTAAAKPFANKLEKANVAASSLLGGDLSGDFALRSKGQSVHGLAANLDGAITFALEDGQLNVALLNLLNLELVDAVKAWVAKQRGVKVPCVLAYLPIKDGVIRSEGLYANPALGEILGDGYVDLGKEIYDVRFATKGDEPVASDVLWPLHFKGKFGGGPIDTSEGESSKHETIKEVLPNTQQESIQVQQTETARGCTKELRERYLPAEDAALAH